MFLNDNAAGSIERPEDDYDKNDPEPGDDQNKRMEGWHIIDSKIELKDRQGNNRTLFKRDTDHMSTQY
jgi:hypothetical protein